MAEEKKERKLDNNQEKAVHVENNSVISAGAGSGKTTVLAERFSDILARDKDCKVEQILTLTFTKKATVEMNDRIYKQLAKVCPDKAKDFYKANIKTIDSYCSQVAKLACNYYGISPDFSQDDETVLQKSNDMALKYLLQHRDDDVFSMVSGGKEYDCMAQELFVDFANEHNSVISDVEWEKDIERQKAFVQSEWVECADRVISTFNEIIRIFNFANDDNPSSFEKYCRELFPLMENIEIPSIDFNESVSETRINFLNVLNAVYKISRRGNSNKQFVIEAKEKHLLIQKDVEILNQLENYIYGYQFVQRLVPYLNEYKAMVDDFKRTSGLLTFKDVAALALDILKNYPEIRQIEKEKYKYIMIDEFQDNNEVQKNLLFMLSEKLDQHEKGVPSVENLELKKLFFVGDEKQSIYRFRGAEVSVFRGLANDFKNDFHELKVNYRSHQALIAAFNSIFGGYSYPPQFGKEEYPLLGSVFYTWDDVVQRAIKHEEVPSYEAVYNKVDISEDAAEEVKKCLAETPFGQFPEIYKPRVTIAIINSEKDGGDQDENENAGENESVNVSKEYLDAAESEAVWVTDKIEELIKNGTKESDIAILFRSVTDQSYYEKLLLKKGIAYTTESVKDFYADGPVNDIISYLNLIAYKSDDYSFTNVLHSPFVNLSFDEIETILSNFDLSQELFVQDVSSLLSEESVKKYEHARDFYLKAVEKSQNESLSNLVSFLWYESGYRYETMLNKRKFMHNSDYDRLFELARQSDVKGLELAEFIDCLSAYKENKLEGLNMPFEYADGVNLLTIHKSKGLEYPVVFVVGCGNRTSSDKNDSLLYKSDDFGITVNTQKSPCVNDKSNYFYEVSKELNKQMESAEYRRLIYVAITRAEKYVYLSGKYNFKKWIPDSSNSNGSQSDKVKFNKGDEKPCVQPFFDILRPCLLNYITADRKIKPELENHCPFVFEEIQYAKREDTFIKDVAKENVINTFSDLFENAQVVNKEVIDSPYTSPSKLHSGDEEFYTPGVSKIVVDKNIPYSEIDELVKDSVSSDKNEPDFAYNNFGTIAHHYLECAVKNEKPLMLNREIVGLHGSEKKIATVDKVCSEMKDKFLKSEIGKQLLETVGKNKFHQSEYDFKSKIKDKIINGQIDLVFENPDDDGYTIVDYKTNREIKPEIYYQQLACYRDAVAKMLCVPESKIRCVLYYLRYAESRDITVECDKINLEDLIVTTYN